MLWDNLRKRYMFLYCINFKWYFFTHIPGPDEHRNLIYVNSRWVHVLHLHDLLTERLAYVDRCEGECELGLFFLFLLVQNQHVKPSVIFGTLHKLGNWKGKHPRLKYTYSVIRFLHRVLYSADSASIKQYITVQFVSDHFFYEEKSPNVW